MAIRRAKLAKGEGALVIGQQALYETTHRYFGFTVP
jgi:hypothetical protein